MQEPLGRVQVVDRVARHAQHRQRQPQPLAHQAAAIKHTDADTEQKLVDDAVVVEAAEHAKAAQHFADQQQCSGHQQQLVALPDKECQAKQKVEEHLEVQRPANVQGRVQAVATGVLCRNEQHREQQVMPGECLVWHPLAEGQQQ
ncbi:hypothetical protein D3C78_658120 [compost metagenome]